MAKRNSLKVAVAIGPGLPQRLGGLSAAKVKRSACAFLTRHGVMSASLSIVFLPAPAIRKINKTHLGHDHVTDIITFDLGDKMSGLLEGELVICPTEAVRNAKAFGEPVGREVLRYVAHGILHLLGHDDATEKMRAAMRREEDKLLALIWP